MADIRAQVIIDGDPRGLRTALAQSEADLAKLDQTGKKVDILATAIQNAKDARAEFVRTRDAAQVLDEQLALARGAGAGKDAIKLLQAELKDASRELASAEKAWDKNREKLDQARAAAAAAGVDTRNLAAEQGRLKTETEAAAAAVARSAKALQDAAIAAQEKIAQDRAAAAEEQRLAQIVEMNTNRQKLAARELLEAEKRTYAEAEAAARRAATAREEEARAIEAFTARTKKALADSFSAVGIRGSAEIQGEILNIQQSLLKLGASAKVSGADFDRAFAEAKTRIAALEAEMAGTLPAMNRMEAGAKGLKGELGAMVGQLAALGVAMQAGRMFVDANAQAESLTRTLTQLAGSSRQAAAEMEYIRGAANRLGLDVQDAGKSYTQLLAATKGTALEGEAARRVFEAVAGAMASLGKSSAETNNALLAVNQMASKGTVQMEELKGQLGEALPGALKAAANGAGLTVAELTKMIETGGVLAEDLLPALAKGLRDMYGVGKAENDTFTAQWARMKNSVTELFVAVGEAGPMKVLSEAVALTAFEVKGASILFGALVGKVSELFGGPQWDAEKARKALEDVARSSGLLSKIFDLTKESGSQLGGVMREQSASALQLQSAFEKANSDISKQITNLEKLAAARKAEGDAAARASQLYDTESQQRRATIAAAEAQEAAMRRIAEQTQFAVTLKETELAKEQALGAERGRQVATDIANTKAMIDSLQAEAASRGQASAAIEHQIAELEAYLRALQAERLGMGAESEARKKKIEALQEEIEAKKALADKAQQEATAAHVATLAAQAAAETYKDHAKQVYALRDAHQAAAAAFEKTGEAYVKGIATERELTAAKEAAQKALLLYRDALADATAAAERHVAAEKSAASLQQSALQNDLYRATTILEIAKQRGNEKDIAEAQIKVWRIELEIADAQAQAARLEAEAMLLVAKAKRAQLEASGELTEAKKAELALADANIKAKNLEAEKYDLIAERMRKLSYETNELKSSFGELSQTADEAATSADRAAGSYDRLASSIRSAGEAKDGWARDAAGNVVTVGTDIKSLSVQRTTSPEQAQMFEQLYGYFYTKLKADPQFTSSTRGFDSRAAEEAAASATALEVQRRSAPSVTQGPGAGFGYGTRDGGTVTLKLDLAGRITTVPGVPADAARQITDALRNALEAQH